MLKVVLVFSLGISTSGCAMYKQALLDSWADDYYNGSTCCYHGYHHWHGHGEHHEHHNHHEGEDQ